jgi:hypothetical protein
LLWRSEGKDIILYHRLSKLKRGPGEWREVNPMLVIAKADELPVV